MADEELTIRATVVNEASPSLQRIQSEIVECNNIITELKNDTTRSTVSMKDAFGDFFDATRYGFQNLVNINQLYESAQIRLSNAQDRLENATIRVSRAEEKLREARSKGDAEKIATAEENLTIARNNQERASRAASQAQQEYYLTLANIGFQIPGAIGDIMKMATAFKTLAASLNMVKVAQAGLYGTVIGAAVLGTLELMKKQYENVEYMNQKAKEEGLVYVQSNAAKREAGELYQQNTTHLSNLAKEASRTSATESELADVASETKSKLGEQEDAMKKKAGSANELTNAAAGLSRAEQGVRSRAEGYERMPMINNFGGFQTGGLVPQTGLYVLHEGEKVVAAHEVHNTTPTVVIENATIRSEADVEKVVREITTYLRKMNRGKINV